MKKSRIVSVGTRMIVYGLLASSLWAAPKTATLPEVPDQINLSQAVELAYDRNPDVLKQKQQVTVAAAQYEQTRGEWLLQMKLTANYQQFERSQGSIDGDQGSVTLDASQPVVTFGRLGNTLKGAKAYFRTQEVLTKSVRQNVRLAVTQAFYGVLLQQQLVKVNEESLAIAEDQLRRAQIRFVEGVNTELDVTRAKVKVAQSKTNVITARNNLVQSRNAFNQLLQVDANRNLQLVGDLNYSAYSAQTYLLRDTAEKNRPDLDALKQQIIQYESLIGLRKAQNYPIISIGGSVGWTNQNFYNKDDDRYDNWLGYVSMSWPIIEGGKTLAQIKEARALHKAAQIEYEKALLAVHTEVEQTVRELTKQDELVQSALENIQLAEQSLKMNKVAFENGRATSFDVADAELNLTAARVSHAQAVYGYQVALAQLQQVVGLDQLP